MLERVSMRNFRCFQHIEISSFSRLTIVVGKSNSGKTSFLEGLFLLQGWHNPGLTLHIDNMRGVSKQRLRADHLWGWLFYDKNFGEPARIDGAWSDGRRETLNISLSAPTLSTPSSSEDIRETSTGITGERNLLFTHSNGSGGSTESAASIDADGQIRLKSEGRPANGCTFLSSRVADTAENSERFSEASRRGRVRDVVDALKHLEPRIDDLSLLDFGAGSVIHAHIGLSEAIPVHMLGGGTNKLLTILLAIKAMSGGMVLIDEIENGLYHDALPAIWSAILDAATKANCQVVVSTHSYEVIKAAVTAFHTKGRDDDLSLFRIERLNGESRAVVYEPEVLEAAVASSFEIR